MHPSPVEALAKPEAPTPSNRRERRVLQPLRSAVVRFARYLPCPLIAKQLGRCELERSPSSWRSNGLRGSVLPPLGATMVGEHEVRGAQPLEVGCWGMPGGEREARAQAEGRRSRRGRSPQEAVLSPSGALKNK